MEDHKHEDLQRRIDQLEADFNFAAGKCAEGLHAVTPVVRERIAPAADPADPNGTVVVREFFLSCSHCDKLFGLQTNILGGMHVFEMDVDRDKLDTIREPLTEPPQNGEVVEAELLDADEFNTDDVLEADDYEEPEDGGGLHRF